jgi:hypothetical protein
MDDFQSNIVVYLMKQFISTEMKSTILLIVLSLSMNILNFRLIKNLLFNSLN